MAIIGGRAHNLEEIKMVSQLGYPFAEINIDDHQEIDRQLDDLLKLKKQHKIYYLAHYPNEGNPSDVNTLRDKFVPKMKKLIDFSPDLGIKKGTIHFWMDSRWASDNLISAKIELLSELVAHAAEKNMVLCLENLTSRHESFAMVFEAIPDLRMTMDIGHAELASKQNTSFGFMEHLFHKIEHVHVHDNYGGTTVKDDLHLALGEGIIDYAKILSMLNQKKYNSTITLEVKPSDMSKTKQAVELYI